MDYQAFKRNSQKEYLGYCELKGFVYSVQIDSNKYAVVALKNGQVEVLITYRVKHEVSV
ncbi:hypothetical protein O3V59_14015 [Brevibacillus thermoruber]|jgi:hypothetical protein|uniref:Uncharacterized protein n=1 Tax=Brevibacillus thermoruber TaxID=33942 RepID=A0A9X3TRW7_9BACL|nr:hypothetical protein [Brevibacillus thermoruber]MDA5109481.1 hypothetical protein [Brevibacillus thermoruber]